MSTPPQPEPASSPAPRRWPWVGLLFLALAFFFVLPRVTYLDGFSEKERHGFYADSPLLDIVDLFAQGPAAWIPQLHRLHEGSSVLGGRSLPYMLALWSVSRLVGFGAVALKLVGLGSFLACALFLWLMVRRRFTGLQGLLFGLVVLGSSWFQLAALTPTFHSFSLAVTMLALWLTLAAQRRISPALMVLAGLAHGVNLYGFVVNRAAGVIILGCAALFALLGWEGWRKVPPRRRLLALAALLGGLLLPLGANLADPLETARILFAEQEVVTGEIYAREVRDVPRLILRNLAEFWRLQGNRLWGMHVQLAVFGLALLGAGLALRRRRIFEWTLLALFVGQYLAISLLTNMWTLSRMAPLSLPMLALAALALGWLSQQLERRSWHLTVLLMPTFCTLVAMDNLSMWGDLGFRDPAFSVARRVASLKRPLPAVVEVGDHESSHRVLNVIRLALVERGKWKQARHLLVYHDLRVKDLERVLRGLPLETLVLRVETEGVPPPDLSRFQLRLWYRAGPYGVFMRPE